ncbi:MAG: hypothetical protein HY293_20320 [Planctomycetes bacterium]|nr:hypothetical protein [Planctomycetota bacterium]
MRQAALALLILAGCGHPDPPPSPAKPDRKFRADDRTKFLLSALFDGLLEDFPDPAIFQPILKEEDKYFVAKCLICWPVTDGLKAYLKARESWRYPSENVSKFPQEIKDGLTNPDRAARLKAIEAMVERYVARRFETSGMTSGEKQSMKSWLIMGKKYGMSVKEESFGDFCPSCNGATK